MSSLEIGRKILRDSLVDFMSQSKPFEGSMGVLNNRYYFNKNCNHGIRRRLQNREEHEMIAKQKWARQICIANGQTKNHPQIGWFVGKLLSTTTLIITNDEQRGTYWSVFKNYEPEAHALEMLSQHNQCWGDWTLSIPVVAAASG